MPPLPPMIAARYRPTREVAEGSISRVYECLDEKTGRVLWTFEWDANYAGLMWAHGPRATLGPPVAVAIPKPRTLAQLMHDKDAMHSRAHVVEWLTASVRRPRRLQIKPQPPADESDIGLTAVPNRGEA